MADADGTTLENGSAEQFRDLAEVRPELLEGGPVDQRVDLVGFRAGIEGLLDPFASLLGVLALERREPVDFDLDRALAVLRRPGNADNVVDFDRRIRADAGLLEGGTGTTPYSSAT